MEKQKKAEKKEVAPNHAGAPLAPTEQPKPAGFFIPLDIMNAIINYIGKGSYIEVNPLMNAIEKSVQPIYPKNQQINETENKSTSVN